MIRPQIRADEEQVTYIKVVTTMMFYPLARLHPKADKRPAIGEQYIDNAGGSVQPICSRGRKRPIADSNLTVFDERIDADGRLPFEGVGPLRQMIEHGAVNCQSPANASDRSATGSENELASPLICFHSNACDYRYIRNKIAFALVSGFEKHF